MAKFGEKSKRDSFRMKRIITAMLAALCAVTAFSQDPRALIQANPDRLGGVHHMYEAPETIVDTKAPRGYRPFYISHYGRHGSRYMFDTVKQDKVLSALDPIAADGLLTAEGKTMYDDFKALRAAHEGMAGYLTQRGAREHREIAHRLMMRCPQVFRQKERREIVAVSSTIQRCIQSMANFIGQVRSEYPDLEVSMYSGPRYMKYILHPSSKQKDIILQRAIIDSTLNVMFDPERVLTAWFTDTTAIKKHFGTYDARHLIYDIYFESCIAQCLDEEIPTALSLMTEDELFNLWYADNMRVLNGECMTVENGSFNAETASYALRDILDKADEALAAGSRRAADFRFGHDSGLMPLLALMGIEGYPVRSIRGISEPGGMFVFNTMPMGSSLQMIFYKNKSGDILVKFVRNEMETSIPDLTPVSGPYYRWADARRYLEGKIVEEI